MESHPCAESTQRGGYPFLVVGPRSPAISAHANDQRLPIRSDVGMTSESCERRKADSLRPRGVGQERFRARKELHRSFAAFGWHLTSLKDDKAGGGLKSRVGAND